MIKNQKGFAITEVLILSTVIIGVLVFMYAQFKSINRTYQYSFRYDTPESMYLANNIVNFINEDTYDYLVSQMAFKKNGYMDITNCGEKLYGLMGDVDKDGHVDAVDASHIASVYEKKNRGEPLTASEQLIYSRSDVNEDGVVNAEDSDLVLHNYAILQTSNTNLSVSESVRDYCKTLLNKSGVEKILFAEEDLKKVKKENKGLENDLVDYIKQIKTTNESDDYRIVVKYTDGTFASIKFNKGNAYVKDGLYMYLDAINNTGSGHSKTTTTWKDLSGNEHDATLYNTPAWTTNSLIFNGTNQYGKIPSTADVGFLDGYTLEARVKILSMMPTEPGQEEQQFFGNWETGGTGLAFEDTYQFEGSGLIDNSWVYTTSPNTSNLGEYYTVVLTYKNSTMKLYVNGTLVKTQSTAALPVSPSELAYAIGGNPSATTMDTYSNVEFQNVLIYERPLSAQEIERNYHADQMRY